MSIKGVSSVIDCPLDDYSVNSVPEIRDSVVAIARSVLGDAWFRVEYENSEPIGYTHTLHRFRLLIDNDRYIGARAVVRGTRFLRVLFTIPFGYGYEPRASLSMYKPDADLRDTSKHVEDELHPPSGQVYISIPIVYAILGVPQADVSKWSLQIEGDVDNPAEFNIVDLYELGLVEIETSFHCVTGWSIRRMMFTGVPISKIVELVKPRGVAKWVYIESLDGYTTIIPYDDFNRERSIIALEMNGKPLDILHGYPARLIVPHLYGWKSAKWVSKIVFTNEYKDGYWEALGYHPRGNVALEERFKQN